MWPSKTVVFAVPAVPGDCDGPVFYLVIRGSDMIGNNCHHSGTGRCKLHQHLTHSYNTTAHKGTVFGF